jgi:glycosyltransferase involved in cell wall biosynthesis
MEPIRILQIFTILNRGGAETNIMNYYRKIDRTKIQFDFLVHREEIGAFEEEILQLGGRIFRLPPINPFKLKNYKIHLNRFFDTNNYQIIHGHCSELGYYIYKEAFNRKIPVIIAHSHNTKANFDFKLPFRLFWKKRMMNYINAYFSCGYEASVWLFGKQKAQNAFIMKNAIDTNNYGYQKEIETQKRLELNAVNTLNLVNIGSFISSKNPDLAIDVFNELLKINSNSKLFFVGKGPLLEQLKIKVKKLDIQEKVHFLGIRNDVNVILQAMDVLLFPSKSEGLPLSFIESQSAGLQCVISDTIPSEAILVRENVTVISLKKEPKYWAKKINDLNIFQKNDTSQQIIECGYDINENAKKLENKYFELLEKHT